MSAGKTLDAREGGKQVVSAVKSRNVQAVVAIKLDSLFRDCTDCLTVVGQWDKVGIALHPGHLDALTGVVVTLASGTR